MKQTTAIYINFFAFCFLMSTSSRADAALIHLDFDSLIAGGVNDVNGIGSGFTHRLPGTGSLFPANDPHIDLIANPGRLTYRSEFSDINQGQPGTPFNGNLSAPGFLLQNAIGKDIWISSLFRGVNVPNLSDQIELYAGVSSNKVMRAGMHQGNAYFFTENLGAGDQNTQTSDNAFSSGDDIVLTLARTGGLWQLQWQNLTSPLKNGSSVPRALPWLDVESSIYVGFLGSNARTQIPFTTQIDYFDLSFVPEPSSILLMFIAIVTLGWVRLLASRSHSVASTSVALGDEEPR